MLKLLLLDICDVHCAINDDIYIIFREKSKTYTFSHEHSIEQVDWLLHKGSLTWRILDVIDGGINGEGQGKDKSQ